MFTGIELASAGVDLAAPLLIALVGSGGLFGAIVAFVKLSHDRPTAAVTQAQGAADVLEEALRAIERDRDYWRGRYEACHTRQNELLAELMELRRHTPRHH